VLENVEGYAARNGKRDRLLGTGQSHVRGSVLQAQRIADRAPFLCSDCLERAVFAMQRIRECIQITRSTWLASERWATASQAGTSIPRTSGVPPKDDPSRSAPRGSRTPNLSHALSTSWCARLTPVLTPRTTLGRCNQSCSSALVHTFYGVVCQTCLRS
jgi:hypothetical protein